ncbi:cupin domain-containing protein [Galbibacter sp. BG1]|uniref:cupin domain-containing protein n=1 Tax=Galbibacter sp. BG1 TaxID=1170699 RepID=UPI0015BA7622|nr:cupin domain-containing protein [Galbibacter sp. BG1]QLE02422.1 cupin domain-containing protein [Galbibacter sp. BG1]
MKKLLILLFAVAAQTMVSQGHEQKNKLDFHNKSNGVQHFNFENLPRDTISEGITRQWFYAGKGQMAYFHLEKGAHIPMHKHPNEQITYILKGKVRIKTFLDGEPKDFIVGAGEVIVFPENVPHEFYALEKTLDLDVHIPVREDWLSNELPQYLRKSN